MPSPQQRKRHQCSEQQPQSPVAKRRNITPPALYWDELSKIWLTKDALAELDRRNSSIEEQDHSYTHSIQQRRRPLTRALRAKLTQQQQSTGRRDTLYGISTESTIKQFARAGGPDLSDIRGGCNH
ncbi:hypothetical protein FQN57_003559 [Myotisia sp. PD_48]|nr:hypothetical protein FQN57_003559 [Myotisia sp. PD_48]